MVGVGITIYVSICIDSLGNSRHLHGDLVVNFCMVLVCWSMNGKIVMRSHIYWQEKQAMLT
ncbi:hypothetical protein Hanom_Chr10g00960661 [Helianthus anomalus]